MGAQPPLSSRLYPWRGGIVDQYLPRRTGVLVVIVLPGLAVCPLSGASFPVPGHLFTSREPYIRKPPHRLDQASQHVES
jgi:hypothetical protein